MCKMLPESKTASRLLSYPESRNLHLPQRLLISLRERCDSELLSDFVHELIVSRVESWAYPPNQCRQSDIRLGQLFISE